MSRRLLYVYPFCNLGGVSSAIKQRLSALRSAGYEVHGLFGVDYGGVDDLLANGMADVTVSRAELDAVGELADDYDVVSIVDMPELATSLAVADLRTALIYEIHSGIESVILKNSNEALTACRMVVVPSEWLKAQILHRFPAVPDSQVQVCANIVDADLFSPGPSSRSADLIWVGKLSEHKNWEEALQIMREYFAELKDPRAYFVTGGRLPDRDMNEFLDRVLDYGLTRVVRWLHNVPYAEMPSLYREVAAGGGMLLQCSISESFGMVVHEAARCGVPAVSRRSGAVAEFVESGESGWIYDDGDVPGAVRGLRHLAGGSEERQKVLEGMERRLESFSPSRLGSHYLSLLDKALQG